MFFLPLAGVLTLKAKRGNLYAYKHKPITTIDFGTESLFRFEFLLKFGENHHITLVFEAFSYLAL